MRQPAINAYKARRTIIFEDKAARLTPYPSRGIVAGDSLNDPLVKAYYLVTLSDFVERLPFVDLEVY